MLTPFTYSPKNYRVAGKVAADRTAVGPWERWTVESHGEFASLRSCHGGYLCLQPSGDVVANRPTCGPWEKFEFAEYSGVPQRPEYFLNELCALSAVMKEDGESRRTVASSGEWRSPSSGTYVADLDAPL